MLTPKQHKLLMYIDDFIKTTGHSPSFEEMKEAVGLKSKSGIHALLNSLEERGFIRKLAHKARALEVIKLPTQENTLKEPSIANDNNETDFSLMIPLYGKIAAGTPIEAIETPDEYFSLPVSLVNNKNEIFTLRVSGESMINVGIYDGDILIVERQNKRRMKK